MSEDDRVRGPPCVALQSKEYKAAPDRDTQYTFVPEAYRIEYASSMASASARVCAARSCCRD
eukprot:2778349-Prymnesium_polylepis.1